MPSAVEFARSQQTRFLKELKSLLEFPPFRRYPSTRTTSA